MYKQGQLVRGEEGRLILARQAISSAKKKNTLSVTDREPEPPSSSGADAGYAGKLVADIATGSRLGERKAKKLDLLQPVTKLLSKRLDPHNVHSSSPLHSSLSVSLPDLRERRYQEFLEAEGPLEEPISEISNDELRRLLGKGVYPVYIDLSGKEFSLTSEEFLLQCPDVVKELNLSNNKIEHLDHTSHLSRLKRLQADGNGLYSITLTDLSSLVFLSLARNRIEILNGMEHLINLGHLDLSDNQLSGGFSELGKLKSLQVLNLSRNNISLSFNRFYQKMLCHLQNLSKLRYLNFSGNPVQATIFKYRFFVISQLPKLLNLDGETITKEQRKKAKTLNEKLWQHRLLLKNPEGSTITRKSDHHIDPSSCFIVDGDPARMLRINGYQMRECTADIRSQPIVVNTAPFLNRGDQTEGGETKGGETMMATSSPDTVLPRGGDGKEREKDNDKERRKAKEQEKKKKAIKRKTWDCTAARGVRFLEDQMHQSEQPSRSPVLPPHLQQRPPAREEENRGEGAAKGMKNPDGPGLTAVQERRQQDATPLVSVSMSLTGRHSVQFDELEKLLEESFVRTSTSKRPATFSSPSYLTTGTATMTAVGGDHTTGAEGSDEMGVHAGSGGNYRTVKRKVGVNNHRETIDRMLDDLLSAASQTTIINATEEDDQHLATSRSWIEEREDYKAESPPQGQVDPGLQRAVGTTTTHSPTTALAFVLFVLVLLWSVHAVLP